MAGAWRLQSTAEARAVLAGTVSERDWQDQVVDLLKLYKWRYYHTWNSRHSVKGFPDLIAVRGTRIIAAELKRERERRKPDGGVSGEQRAWLDALKATGRVESYVFYPSDWSEVVRELQ